MEISAYGGPASTANFAVTVNNANLPSWSTAEAQLFERTCAAIDRFCIEQPQETCSFLAFYIDSEYNYAMIVFDTPENSLENAKSVEAREVQMRSPNLLMDGAWRNAFFTLVQHQIFSYTNNTGSFKYPEFEQVNFAWEEQTWNLFNDFNANLPAENDPAFKQREQMATNLYERYMRGNMMVIVWKVIEKLISSGHVYKLKMASPFRLGFDFHDDPSITVVRITNWPHDAQSDLS